MLAGCGLGRSPGTPDVTLTVTRDFGSIPVAQLSERRASGSESVVQLLERHFRVSARDRGRSVETIDGLSGSSARSGWVYYVNGIEAPQGAATTAVHAGDRIWWDLHDSTASEPAPAVVGSFPEPFLQGIGGRRLPTVLQCAPDASAACKRVSSQLSQLGVPIATQLLGTGSGNDSLQVVVGTWRDVRPEIVASLIEHGPSASGVYARFTGPEGDQLDLLDAHGRVARRLGAGAGLVAATAQGASAPVWLITGTDVAGVSAAAAALTPSRLQNHFSLAVQGATSLPVPLHGTT